jgi:ABC-type transport system involved in multi-copper enzyme maturation permease subunit
MKIPSIKNFRLNAVLFKDLQQKTKRSQLVLSVFLLNLFLSLIATIILISVSVEAAQFSPIDYSVFSTFFIVLGFLEFGFILVSVPAVTSGAITIEREKQTFDVLLTTALTTRQIIYGKYWASITQVMLLIISGFPVFALVFMYGGITFFQAIGVLLTLLMLTMYISAIGLFFSSRMKKTIIATVLTYVILLVLMFGTISFVATAAGITSAINEVIYEQTGVNQNLNCDYLVFIFYLNPLCTIFDSLCGLFGVDILFGEPGMGGILSAITNYSRSNILLSLWTPISIVIQMLVSWWLLEISAKAIDPLRKKADKYAKKRKRNKQTA